MKKILLVSAHPDDMEIGMGGTAAKLAAAGDELVSVVMTDGRRSPDPNSIGQKKMAALRKEEGEAAAGKLGIERTVFFGLESLSSDDVYDEAKARIKEVIGSVDPDEIYTLHPELDRHASHRAAGRITIDAVEQFGLETPVWAYEVWGLFPRWDRFEDISEQISIKVSAINEHRSQVAAISYTDGVTGLNRWRGVFADPHQQKSPASYAEVFIRLR